MTKHLADCGLPIRLQDIAGFAQEGLGDADALLALMFQDKKVKRGKLTFILLKALGQAVIVNDVEPERVRNFLARKARISSARLFPGRVRVDRQRVHAAGKIVGERLVDHAVAVDPALA